MLVRRLVELLTPRSCLNCGTDGVEFCTTCILECGLGKANKCFACHLPSPAGKTCVRCSEYSVLAGVAVGAYYDDAVKELILQLKFHRLRAAEQAASEFIV